MLNGMETMLVKICGVTRPEDAAACVEAGVDYLGVNLFAGSKRFIDLEKCRGWLREFENELVRVAVVVRPDWEMIQRIVGSNCFDLIQMHGEESAEEIARIRSLGLPVIYAIRSDVTCHSDIARELMMCKHVLLDSSGKDGFGGTGEKTPLEVLIAALTRHRSSSCLAAGGLNPENVAEVAKILGLAGVDVAGGVEEAPGIKSSSLIREFVRAAKSMNSYSHQS